MPEEIKFRSAKRVDEECHSENDDVASYSSSGSTVAGAVLNLTNSIVGAGCVGYGGAFADSGGLASLITIAVFALLTKHSFDMIIELGLKLVQQQKEEEEEEQQQQRVSGNPFQQQITAATSSFEAVGQAAYGNLGMASVVISKSLFAFGCMVAYFVIIKDNAAIALQHLTGASSFWTDDIRLTIFLATFFILPLCLQRDISALENFSTIKIAAYGTIAVIVTLLCVAVHGERQRDGDAVNSANWVDHWLTIKPGLLPNTGTFVFAFVSQHVVHLVFLSMRANDRNLKSFSKVSTMGISASAAIMLAVGIPAYMTFWDKSSTDLFLLYPSSHANMVNAARL